MPPHPRRPPRAEGWGPGLCQSRSAHSANRGGPAPCPARGGSAYARRVALGASLTKLGSARPLPNSGWARSPHALLSIRLPTCVPPPRVGGDAALPGRGWGPVETCAPGGGSGSHSPSQPTKHTLCLWFPCAPGMEEPGNGGPGGLHPPLRSILPPDGAYPRYGPSLLFLRATAQTASALHALLGLHSPTCPQGRLGRCGGRWGGSLHQRRAGFPRGGQESF